MKRILTSAATGVIAAAVMVAAVGSNLVVCIGPDGHVCLKLSGPAGQYAPPGAPDHSDCNDTHHEACAEPSDPCCEQCVDIPIPEVNLRDCIVKTSRLTTPGNDVAAPYSGSWNTTMDSMTSVRLPAASRGGAPPSPVAPTVLRI